MIAGTSQYLALQSTALGGRESGLRRRDSDVLEPAGSVTLAILAFVEAENFPSPRASRIHLARP